MPATLLKKESGRLHLPVGLSIRQENGSLASSPRG